MIGLYLGSAIAVFSLTALRIVADSGAGEPKGTGARAAPTMETTG
jgi:hypothetical protein